MNIDVDKCRQWEQVAPPATCYKKSFVYRMTVADILNVLEEDDDIINPSFFIAPPDNPTLSDCDSDDDDTCNINNLSGNQLRGEGELKGQKITKDGLVTIRIGGINDENIDQGNGGQIEEDKESNQNEEGEEEIINSSTSLGSSGTDVNKEKRKTNYSTHKADTQPQKRKTQTLNLNTKKKIKANKKQRIWEKKDIADCTAIEFTRADFLLQDYSPEQLFEFFFDDEVLNYIVSCTNQYALEKGNMNFYTSKNEIKLFFAILFLSGYNTMARYRMYWEVAQDTHNEAVSRAMSRTRFEDLLKYIHFCENNNLDPEDKFSKVRNVMSMLNERWLQYFPGDVYLSIDESMVPYFGRYGAKQHIHGKPIRFGYKVWVLATRLGYAIQAEPYQGKKTGANIPELGVGGSVVIDLISELPQNRKYCLFFDNFFTSMKLLEELKKRGYHGTGTIRADRVEQAPLPDISEIKKQPRGTFEQVTDKDNDITLVRYMDNSVFTMASTVTGVQPMGKAKRWSSSQKKHILVPQPNCVTWYNLNMGGIDRLDENISTYRVHIRNKKWYWPMIAYMLNVSMNNAWQLYRMTPKGAVDKLDLLGFTRHVVQTYLRTSSENRPSAGRPSQKVASRVLPGIRYSGIGHNLETVEKQLRCALCSKATRKRCKTCLVGCHILCTEEFHTP